MKQTSYVKANTIGTSILLLAIAFSLVWLLTACTPTDDTTATKVLGEQVERTTSTTMTFDEPAENNSTLLPDRDGVMSVLLDRVPALNGLTESDIRIRLLGTVCDVIDEADGDFADVGDVIVESSASNFEFTYSDAGYIVGAAVALQCPEWYDAAQEFANS